MGDRIVLWNDRGIGEHGDAARTLDRSVPHRSCVHAAGCARTRLRLSVTAAAAKQAQGAGADDVVLFAALANPTSNAIYRRIGFEAAGDSIRIDFAAA